MKNSDKPLRGYSLLLAALLALSGCTTASSIQKESQQAQQYHITTQQAPDSGMAVEIRPYKDSLDKMMNEVIGRSAVAMTKGRPEGLLNDFTADMTRNYVNDRIMRVDIGLLNYGGLRSDLPKGDITMRNIYELMPFDNEVIVLKLGPAAFKKLLEYIAQSGGMPVSGIRLDIKQKQPMNVTINGSPYDSTRTYTVATSDYLANGGDNMFFLKDAERTTINMKLRDLFIDYIVKNSSKGQAFKPELDGRIRILE